MGLVVAAGLAPEPLLTAGCSWCQGAQGWRGAPGPAGCPPLPSALWASTLPAECSSKGFSPLPPCPHGTLGFPEGTKPHFHPDPHAPQNLSLGHSHGSAGSKHRQALTEPAV